MYRKYNATVPSLAWVQYLRDMIPIMYEQENVSWIGEQNICADEEGRENS